MELQRTFSIGSSQRVPELAQLEQIIPASRR
jgi:hypothetical protein